MIKSTIGSGKYFSISRMKTRIVTLLGASVLALAGCATPPPPPPPAPVLDPSIPVLQIAQIDRGVQIFLPNAIMFEFGKAELSPASQGHLGRVAKLLMSKTQAPVSVEGHTDNVGSQASNQKLSEARAKAVMAALQKLGVPEDRMVAIGFSFDRPAAPNDSEENRKLNRRTEVIVLGETVEKFTQGEHPGTFSIAFDRLKQELGDKLQK